jgi:predicted kinase
MDKAAEEQREPMLSLKVPQQTLLVLSGPTGAGKSTFARKVVETHRLLDFKPTMIISSDDCRALVCDDETNQQVNRDTFDLFYYIINKRMFQKRFTIADSTALYADARRKLLELAHQHHYYTCLLIFNIPLALCVQRDRQRERLVGEKVIAYHMGLLQRAINDAPNEGWDQIHMLGEQDWSTHLEIVPVK